MKPLFKKITFFKTIQYELYNIIVYYKTERLHFSNDPNFFIFEIGMFHSSIKAQNHTLVKQKKLLALIYRKL